MNIKNILISLVAGFVGSLLLITLVPQASETFSGAFAPSKNKALIYKIQTVTADAQLLATSSARLYARVINNCVSDVYLSDSNDVVADTTTGAFLLVANGGSWDSNTSRTFTYTGAVRASSTAAACDLSVAQY